MEGGKGARECLISNLIGMMHELEVTRLLNILQVVREVAASTSTVSAKWLGT